MTVAGGDADDVRTVAGRAYEELKALVEPVLYAEGSTPMEEVVGELLRAAGWKIATAESCTGGLMAKRLTDTAGSSRYFERGFVTYSNASKIELLGVSAADLEKHGAVSRQVAAAMAEGAVERSGADFALSTTGIAGPGGGSIKKPVGTVYIAKASRNGATKVEKHAFPTDRESFKQLATQAALDLLRREISTAPKASKAR